MKKFPIPWKTVKGTWNSSSLKKIKSFEKVESWSCLKMAEGSGTKGGICCSMKFFMKMKIFLGLNSWLQIISFPTTRNQTLFHLKKILNQRCVAMMGKLVLDQYSHKAKTEKLDKIHIYKLIWRGPTPRRQGQQGQHLAPLARTCLLSAAGASGVAARSAGPGRAGAEAESGAAKQPDQQGQAFRKGGWQRNGPNGLGFPSTCSQTKVHGKRW